MIYIYIYIYMRSNQKVKSVYIYIYIYIYISVCVPNQTGCDKMLICKLSNIGLNLEFSFSYIGCLTKAKKKSACCLPLVGLEQINLFFGF